MYARLDVLRASDKMTQNHKWELFVLDLSFLGWRLLYPFTLGLVSIYVEPYYNTTVALYYENFKIRAFGENVISQYDFIGAQEKQMMYNSMYYQSAADYGYGAQNQQGAGIYYQPVMPVYYPPVQPQQPYAPWQNMQQAAPQQTYTPQQNMQQPYAPQQPAAPPQQFGADR